MTAPGAAASIADWIDPPAGTIAPDIPPRSASGGAVTWAASWQAATVKMRARERRARNMETSFRNTDVALVGRRGRIREHDALHPLDINRRARRRYLARRSPGSSRPPRLYGRRRGFHVGHDLPSRTGRTDRRLGADARGQPLGADAVRPHRGQPERRDRAALALARDPARGGAAPRSRPHDDAGDDATHMMPGMLSAEQLAQLERAHGPDFDALFLRLMIQHHQGAITMVNRLFAAGAGEEEPVYKMASSVFADQTTEIERMQRMLAADLFAPTTPK